MYKFGINLGFWNTDHLSLPQADINTKLLSLDKMMAQGRGRWVVSQTPKLIPSSTFHYKEGTTQWRILSEVLY